MKTLIAIVIAISVLFPTVNGTWITDVRWNADLKVIEISFDKFPANWGGWWMYVDEKAWPMEGGSGNVSVRPNAEIGKATGLFVGTDPWLSSLEGANFPCCGTIRFYIPYNGYTYEFPYDLTKTGCKTASPKECATVTPTNPRPANPAPPDRTPPLLVSGIKLLEGVDLPGMNLMEGYAPILPIVELCADDCKKNPDCKAFTYVKPGFRDPKSPPECWLKNGVPTQVPHEYCISGVKEGATPESGEGCKNCEATLGSSEVRIVAPPA